MYRKKKNKKQKYIILILILLCALIIAYSLGSLLFIKTEQVEENFYAGIGGAVIDPGVYHISEHTAIYELIVKAKGLAERADISNIDTFAEVIPFEVYCIPYLPKEVHKQLPEPVYPEVKAPDPIQFDQTERINIVYAGLPRTYMFISLYPNHNVITITHIPWYTRVTTDYEYPRTLYEIYLTGGIPFLLRSMKYLTEQTIDYYFAQKRPSWINFINYLGGIEVNIPADFSKEYSIEEGPRVLDGLLSWAYISYISKEQRREDQWITGSAFRIKRQKEFMLSMYSKFKENNFILQGEIVRKIITEAETNMKAEDFLSLVYKFRKFNEPEISFLTFPGIIREYNGRRMWVPDLQNYTIEQNDLYNRIFKQLDPLQHDKGGFGGN